MNCDVLVFNHVSFRIDQDGDLEIELTVKDGDSYQGRFLSPEQTVLLRDYLVRVTDNGEAKQ